MTAPPFFRGARAAATFLTRIPVGGFPYSEADWRWASGWFPFVGFGLGVLLAAIAYGARGAGPHIAAALVVVASLLLTGAFHEDGLADTADALGGAYTRERVFEILKDSRVGTFGASALACSILLRVLLLARLGDAAPWAIVATQCASRVPPIWLMRALPYVSADAAAKSRLVARAGTAQALLATALGVGGVALVASRLGLTARGALTLVGVSIAVTVVCASRFRARVGGVTGDFLGATQQIVEGALLLALVLAAAR